MVVSQHQHSFTLIDLNPNYPHDEEVYDDEEDLINKQVIQCQCDCCDQIITYSHRYYYKCDQCEYSVHKLCAELPTELKHASHNAHTVTLFLNKSLEQCHMCYITPQYKQLCYHCSECMFNICLECSLGGLQYHTIYHPSHQHPLIPVSRQRHILAECDACGKEHKGVFYVCNTCFNVFIHSDCVFQPKRLLIQEGTRDRFFHTHQLILSYSFPVEYQKAKFYPTCKVCDNSFFDNRKFWVYKCEKCRYYVHVACASLRCDTSGTNIASKNYAGRPNVLHLPFFSQTDQVYNKITNFFFKERNKMNIITHSYHEHPLTLMDTRHNDTPPPLNKVEDLCNACVGSIMGVPFYKCTYGCNFVLHEWCTRLPDKLKDFKGHSGHPLLLLPKIRYNGLGLFVCDVCRVLCNGFAYSCVKCTYVVDVTCAFIPTNITHKSHPHHLLSIVKKREDKDYCRMCLSHFTNDKETSFSCKSCNFHLHPKCAFLLPETIRNKYDKHPMTLGYFPIESHEGDYFCEECEEELNPNACFYHCHECVQSMHSACAMLIPQSNPYIFNSLSVKGVSDYENIKFGSIHKIEYHSHPLSLLQVTKNENNCSRMGHHRIPCRYPNLVLKCLQCNFSLHAECAIMLKWKFQ